MDELSSWCEVLQALLPTMYVVRIVGDGTAAIVTAKATGHSVWLTTDQLAGRSPSRVVDRIRRQLVDSNTPEFARAAC
jgi:hypothetical protein